MITVNSTEDTYIIEFNNITYWDEFKSILSILKSVFAIQVVHRLDGPDSRVWIITLNDQLFSLSNNSSGNKLKAPCRDSVTFLKNNIEQVKKAFAK